MANYDINDVHLIVNNNIITGFSDGTVISIEKEEDNFETHVGVKGEVDFTETHNNIHTVTITLKQTSPSVGMLKTLANRRGKAAEVPLRVIDLNDDGGSRRFFGGTRARVKKMPNIEYQSELSEVEFEFVVADGEFL